MEHRKQVVVAGGTGYLGLPLIQRLSAEGHRVVAIARPGSVAKLPKCCEALPADVLCASTYLSQIPAQATFVHMVGVAHPAPWKAASFRAVDLVSLQQSLLAAKRSGASHFVFVSVAQPAPVMKAYVAVRRECEALLRESDLNVTILRPWYILGPGHRWPSLLIPAYRVMEAIKSTRETAIRLGLVSREQMVRALAGAVSSGPGGFRIIETAGIRAA